MPILHAFFAEEPQRPETDPAHAFAEAAGVDPTLVTVNVTRGAQYGSRYGATVTITIPDAWESQARTRFLLAAGVMLDECYGVPPADSIVILHLVRSGEVADRGKPVSW